MLTLLDLAPQMIDRVFSKSYVAYRSAEEKAKIEADLRKFLAEWTGREWVDEAVRSAALKLER